MRWSATYLYPLGVYCPEPWEEVIDPVCGMSVDPSTAAGAWPYRGSTYYFCSVGCLERFKADAEGVLATRAERSLDGGTGGWITDPRG